MKGENIETILYTVKEVAELLKTNVDYIHKLRKKRFTPLPKIRSI